MLPGPLERFRINVHNITLTISLVKNNFPKKRIKSVEVNVREKLFKKKKKKKEEKKSIRVRITAFRANYKIKVERAKFEAQSINRKVESVMHKV